MADHLDTTMLEKLVQGSLDEEEGKRIARHLFDRCPACASNLVDHAMAKRWNLGSRRYDGAFRRLVGKLGSLFSQSDALHKRAVEERKDARALLPQLRRWRPNQIRIFAKLLPGLATFGAVEVLIEETLMATRAHRFEEALALGSLATRYGKLIAEKLGQEAHHEIHARAWAVRGNALRAAQRYLAATRAFRAAERILFLNPGDPITEVELLGFRASLTYELGDFPTSVVFLSQALGIAIALDEHPWVAKLTIKQASSIGLMAPELAIPLLRKIVPLTKAQGDDFLLLCALHNLAWFHTELDDGQEASLAFQAAQSFYDQPIGDGLKIQRRWLAARLLALQGQPSQAIRELSQLAQEAKRQGYGLETGLLRLDQAELLFEQAYFAEAKHLALEATAELQQLGAHHHVLEAWKQLTKACQAEALSETLVGALALYLRRAWKNPGFGGFEGV